MLSSLGAFMHFLPCFCFGSYSNAINTCCYLHFFGWGKWDLEQWGSLPNSINNNVYLPFKITQIAHILPRVYRELSWRAATDSSLETRILHGTEEFFWGRE